jgi:hypothetical protein
LQEKGKEKWNRSWKLPVCNRGKWQQGVEKLMIRLLPSSLTKVCANSVGYCLLLIRALLERGLQKSRSKRLLTARRPVARFSQKEKTMTTGTVREMLMENSEARLVMFYNLAASYCRFLVYDLDPFRSYPAVTRFVELEKAKRHFAIITEKATI